MDRHPVTPGNISSEEDSHAYLDACSRVMGHIVPLVEARGVTVAVDIDPGRASSEVVTTSHQIQLRYGRAVRIVAVDHETFMDPEFFQTLVLHQLEAAINELAASS
jgi:hypothetical protein